MSYKIKGTSITLTKGDTFRATVSITDSDGESYIPEDGDSIRFAMKQNYTDESPLILKDIPVDTMCLQLDPDDTKSLDVGKYVYDIELTRSNGDVDTFITKSSLELTEEVY